MSVHPKQGEASQQVDGALVAEDGSPAAPVSVPKSIDEDSTRGGKKGYGLIAAIYLLGLCMGALDMGIVNPARTVIQMTLGVDNALGVWVITIYSLAYAVSIPIMGKLADSRGRKNVYLLCILLFGVGSLLCGVAHNVGSFGVLMLARVVQALGGGGIMPVATAEFGTAFPEEKRGMALGIVGMVYGLASILGPSIGSLILAGFGQTEWQYIFYINVPICVVVLALGVAKLPAVEREEVAPIDGWGILVLTVMTLSLMYGLKNIDFFDFANSITSLDVWPYLVVFVVLLPVFNVCEKHAADPVITIAYFKNKNIVITLICAVVSGIVMMGTIFYPQFSENAMMMKSGSGGYFIAILGIGTAVGAMGSGKLIDAHGVKPVLGMGFVGCAVGSLFMAVVACNYPNLLTVCLTMLITGLGLGFTMGAPLNYMMLENTDDAQSNSALAMMSLIRSIGTAVAPAIMVAFVAHAGMSMQANIMNVMPDEVTVSPLPHARELDAELAQLRSNPATASMLDGVDIPNLEDYETVQIDMDAMSSDSDVQISDDMLAELQGSDVTTITDACKDMAHDMFGQVKPQLVENSTAGISQGIDAMQAKLDQMDAALAAMPVANADMQTARDQMATTISQLEDVRDAMPAMFDEAEDNYVAEIDDNADAIRAEYQQTMNGGFRQMAFFVVVCAVVGMLALVPYEDSKRTSKDS